MKRDFSAVLSILLDAEMPEEEAVLLAGRCTGNSIFLQRAKEAGDLLAEGSSLVKALAVVDESGELKWRVKNAAQQGGDFSSALSGWHQILEARSVYQEQAVSDIASTSMVVVAGLAVALVATACLLPVFSIMSVLVG